MRSRTMLLLAWVGLAVSACATDESVGTTQAWVTNSSVTTVALVQDAAGTTADMCTVFAEIMDLNNELSDCNRDISVSDPLAQTQETMKSCLRIRDDLLDAYRRAQQSTPESVKTDIAVMMSANDIFWDTLADHILVAESHVDLESLNSALDSINPIMLPVPTAVENLDAFCFSECGFKLKRTADE